MSRKKGALPVSSTTSVAAPIGGWNARDALGAMGPMDAVTLTNLWPGTSSVVQRYGYSQQSTGLPTYVESLLAYNGTSTTKLFACSGTAIYDISAGGAVGAAVRTGLANARFQYTNITTPANSFIMAVNGADKLQYYDGTTWHSDGDGAPYLITGVDTAGVIGIIVFKHAVWMIENNSLKAWYLPPYAIGGVANSLDMSALCNKGGHLVGMATWTLDAGEGADDYLAFITSKGQTIIWQIVDPTNQAGINEMGVWDLGSPVGRRCMMKYAGDLLIITQDGLVPMAGALQSSRLDPRVSLTDKIQLAVSNAITSYGGNFGWQLAYFPKQNQLYLNVPVQEGSQQQQYVMNTITKAWCNFTNWEACCMEIYNDNLYFGANGFVGQAWNTIADNGADITTFGLQSFQYYGSALEKQCVMIRPHLLSNGSPSIYMNVNADFDLSDTTAALAFTPTSYATWDTAVWDTDVWGQDLVSLSDWQGANGIGYAFAPVFKSATNGVQVQWVSTDLVFQQGGVL